jgi:hypothetical protein
VTEAASGTDRALFLGMVLANRWNVALLDRLPGLGLPDWWLTAGCLTQSVWNALHGRPAEAGILDYDVFYFDPETSWAAEDAAIARVAAACADLPVRVEVRNQARVPLWYADKFGVPYPPVVRAADGIDRFPCAGTCVGVRRQGAEIAIHAPFGLGQVLRGELRPNRALDIPAVYAAKTARWRAEWPQLTAWEW